MQACEPGYTSNQQVWCLRQAVQEGHAARAAVKHARRAGCARLASWRVPAQAHAHRGREEARHRPSVDRDAAVAQPIQRRLQRRAVLGLCLWMHQHGAGQGAPQVLVGRPHRRLQEGLLRAAGGAGLWHRHLQGGRLAPSATVWLTAVPSPGRLLW